MACKEVWITKYFTEPMDEYIEKYISAAPPAQAQNKKSCQNRDNNRQQTHKTGCFFDISEINARIVQTKDCFGPCFKAGSVYNECRLMDRFHMMYKPVWRGWEWMR